MSREWWRLNAVPLGVIVVLLPASVGIIAVNEWSEFDLGNATKPITVQPGESVSYAGAVIGPAKAVATDDPMVPAGAKVVTATVLITPGEEPLSCRNPVLRETEGTQRQWNEVSIELDRDYDPQRRASCDSEQPIRYSLTLEYIVPEDATGPFAIEIETGDAYPEFARLMIEP